MKSLQQNVDQMNLLLNELIQVAAQLRNMSLQVVSEEELAPLQKRQEDLLSQIENIDQNIQRTYRNQLSSNMQKQFHTQLQTFQLLNQEYIQNMSASHGLIQFELHRMEDQSEQDFTQISRLNQSPLSPDSSPAVESEKDEES